VKNGSRKRSGKRRAPRATRGKIESPLTDETLKEATLYLLQLVVERFGQPSEPSMIKPFVPAATLNPDKVLAGVVQGLLAHRDRRRSYSDRARLVDVVGDAANLLRDRGADEDVARELARRAAAISFPLDEAEAQAALRAVEKRTGREEAEGVLRRELGKLVDAPSNRTIQHLTNIMRANKAGPAELPQPGDSEGERIPSAVAPPKGGIKSLKEALNLICDMPPMPASLRTFVNELLNQADVLIHGKLRDIAESIASPEQSADTESQPVDGEARVGDERSERKLSTDNGDQSA
jgi:hypothetical protein